jgi:raffinose/stachyose/melibiose transport system permease protein
VTSRAVGVQEAGEAIDGPAAVPTVLGNGGRDSRSRAARRAGRVSVGLERPRSFLVPALLFYGIFFVVPNILDFFLAFTNWSTYHSGYQFNGLSNFRDLITEGNLKQSIVLTLEYAAVVVVVENVLGLLLALALERPTVVHQVIRVVLFFPVFLVPLAAGYAFKGVLEPTGPVDTALSFLLGQKVTTPWLASFSYSIIAVALIQAWKFLGLNMTVYLAGLSTISPEIIGAAKVDGATGFSLFRRVKMPLLAPALTISVVLGFVGSLSAFDIIIATTQGGPGTSTTILNVYVWISYVAGALGQATAVSLSLLVLIVLSGLPVIIAMRRRERLLFEAR